MHNTLYRFAIKHSTLIILALIFTSCTGDKRLAKNNAATVIEGTKKKSINTTDKSTHSSDSLMYYWKPDYGIYSFDTIINNTNYHMKTYCLNDSAVYNETFSDLRKKNKKLIEYSVAHNYATDIIIKKANKRNIKLCVTKKHFKASLDIDFYKICHMWKNEFSHIDGSIPVFRATLAQPDTDYQYAIEYTITDKGELIVIKVEDESYHGSDDE
ncbi:DUF4738 domain-containing protein [Bacteroides sedimenti]